MSALIDKLSEYLAHRKGLLPLVGIALILANLVLGFLVRDGWLVTHDVLLQLGVVISIFGLMLAWAL
jgi:hypothetical protein